MKTYRITIIIATLTLIIGFLFGWLIFRSSSEIVLDEAHLHATQIAGEPLPDLHADIWTCAMHPHIRQTEPGNCPICGMNLITLENNQGSEFNPKAIRMTATAMQLANVQTSVIGKMEPLKSIRLSGKVQVDETLISKIPAHFHGRIEKLNINFTGEQISKGQLMAEVYSPELVTAQQELQLAYQDRDVNPALYHSARKKLENWKIAESEIKEIEISDHTITNVKIHAHHSGFVLTRNVAQGDHVQMGDILFEIANLSKVWVQFDVYESDLPWIKKGDNVSFTMQSLPGETFEGIISYLDPVLNSITRVVSARIEVPNRGLRLKPEMFASGIVEAKLTRKSNAIVIPKSAVMWTGKRSVVYVKSSSEEGVSFLMREVTLGPSLGDSFIVEKGLQLDDEIAVNGTFSIDAAAQLSGKPSMMNREEGTIPMAHEHGRMN